MARTYEIIATRNGIHYILFGLDAEDISTFKLQAWITHYGVRIADWVQAMSLNFISFMGGDIWVHNDDNQDRCNLFGEKRDCIVGVISNEEPTRVKLFDSMGVYSDDTWEITEITIPPTLNYPNGMYSKLPEGRFKKRDGVWRAEFLRNMKTDSDTISVINAVNGEPLRGTHMYMKMKNTSNDKVSLFKVEVLSTKSRV